MAQVNLRALTGRLAGSRSSRRLRTTGAVPGVLYGRGLAPLLVSVNHHDLQAVLHTEAGANVLINLEIDGSSPVLTLARQVQRHPYRNEIRHVDFIKVDLTEIVEASVPIRFEGTPSGLKEGGVFSALQNTVEVEALPTAIPNFIAVDVSSLEIGDALRVSDLPTLEGVRYLDDLEEVIATVSVIIEKVEEVPEVAEAEEEAAEAAPEGEEEAAPEE